MNGHYVKFSNGKIWTDRPNVYIISTDQGEFTVKAMRLNYRETIREYYKNGYTGVRIAYVGKAL